MFGRKKGKKDEAPAAKKTGRGSGGSGGNLAGMFGLQMPSDDSDGDYEAELAALEGRTVAKKKKPKQKVMNMQEIEALHAQSMKIGEEDDDDDDDIDEDDLMAELEGICSDEDDVTDEVVSAPVVAEKQPPRPKPAVRSAEAPPRPAAAPRQSVPPSSAPVPKPRAQPSDIPVSAVTTAQPSSVSASNEAAPASAREVSPNVDPAKLNMLTERRQQYVMAAKQSETPEKKKRYARIVIQFDKVIKAYSSGQPIDLSQMPPPPPGFSASSVGATPRPEAAPAPSPVVTGGGGAASQGSDAMSSLQSSGTVSSGPVQAVAAPAAATPVVKEPGSLLEALQQRFAKYDSTQKAAQAAGESSKARRMGRIAKQYQDAMKACKAKRKFDYEELPCPPGFPPLPLGGPAPAVKAAPPPSAPLLESATLVRSSAVEPANDVVPASVAASSVAGQGVDSSTSSGGNAASLSQPLIQLDDVAAAAPTDNVPSVTPRSSGVAVAAPAQGEAASGSAVAAAVQEPGSLLEALQQRFAKYDSTQKAAQAAGESSKARRMGRIAKQYQDAMKACKAKRKFDYEELPCPPGFPPLPLGGPAPAVKAAPPPGAPLAESAVPVHSLDSSIKPSMPTAPAVLPARPSINDQQATVLAERFAQYRDAALAAKKAGKNDEAISLMRQAKGMEPMLQAAESGLPVNLDALPPALDDKETAMDVTQSLPVSGGVGVASTASPTQSLPARKPVRTEGDDEIFKRLAGDLKRQIDVCTNNAAHYKRMGDLNGSSKFVKEAASLQGDLDRLTNSNKYGEPAPRFHYEEREFPLIRCFPELGDGDAEVVVVGCQQIPLPSGYKEHDMHVYIVVTFPFPHDDEPSAKTDVVKHSVSPSFNRSLRFSIDRKARALQRTIKRHPVKLEVMYERGFLQSDRSLGVASVPIGDLEKVAEVHSVVDIMDGRKACGGKVEARVRLREPLAGADVKTTTERWLVIDDYAKTTKKMAVAPPKPQAAPAAQSGGGGETQPAECLEVLRYEKQRLEKQIAQLREGKQRVPDAVVARHKAASDKASALEAKIRSGGKTFLKTYVPQLQRALRQQHEKAQQCVAAGDKAGAQNALLYKKLIAKEIERWQKVV